MRKTLIVLCLAALGAFSGAANAGTTAAAAVLTTTGGENISDTQYQLEGGALVAGILNKDATDTELGCTIVGDGQTTAPAPEDSIHWVLTCSNDAGLTLTADLTGDHSRPNSQGQQAPVAIVQFGGVVIIADGDADPDEHVLTCKGLLSGLELTSACAVL